MAVLDAQGTTITFAGKTIGGAVSYSFGDGEATDIDVSTLASDAKEWRKGLQDGGNLTIELMRDPGDEGQAELSANKALKTDYVEEVVIELEDGTQFEFDAYCKSISTAGGVDAVVTGTATLKVTGAITETPAP